MTDPAPAPLSGDEYFRRVEDPDGVIRFEQILVTEPVANGTATLAAGTVDVADVKTTADSIVKVWNIDAGGDVGALSVVLDAGIKFTINSTSGTDTSKVYYEVVSY